MKKILLACPTYKKMEYCDKEFFERITNLTYPYYDILIIDNSKDNHYFEKLNKILSSKPNIKIIKDDVSEEKAILRVISSRNKIIKYALDKNYDFILMMDSDVIPSKNIIEELLECDKDIVSGLYYNYFQDGQGKVDFLPVAWKLFTEEEFKEIKKKYPLPDIVKSREDLRRHLTKKECESNELIKTIIPSAGCMLIKRKVFSEIKYGLLDIPGVNTGSGDDIYFLLKAREQGFNSYCYTKVKCEHLIEGKYEINGKGEIIHPAFT